MAQASNLPVLQVHSWQNENQNCCSLDTGRPQVTGKKHLPALFDFVSSYSVLRVRFLTLVKSDFTKKSVLTKNTLRGKLKATSNFSKWESDANSWKKVCEHRKAIAFFLFKIICQARCYPLKHCKSTGVNGKILRVQLASDILRRCFNWLHFHGLVLISFCIW